MPLPINCYNIIQCDAVVGCGVNAETFYSLLRRLVGVLGERDFTIGVDNVRFHHTAVNNMDHFPYDFKFLPRYSPFLNSYEEAFSVLKNMVRRDGVPQGTNDLVRRMTDSCVGIHVNSLSNFVTHDETFSNKCLNLEDIPRD
ncbi:hypothetical protein RF11_09535 [Thelohanellus kitauei]|uniref:Tc1-like transposase DDE domain-containing protein n=1 Tax=Thelohanellus kitauei TaxID=669202 RepID=A0A0C2MFK5_THEKT|nr:hypothetical protein RF11_09535 [Thelohanellus kitauei]